jgi:hypothetical protein
MRDVKARMRRLGAPRRRLFQPTSTKARIAKGLCSWLGQKRESRELATPHGSKGRQDIRNFPQRRGNHGVEVRPSHSSSSFSPHIGRAPEQEALPPPTTALATGYLV